jgi:hypothetical protein
MSYCKYDAGNKCAVCGHVATVSGLVRECGIATARAGKQSVAEIPPQRPTRGPGTELSRLLKRFGIQPTPTCQCRAKAAEMDAWGPDEASKPERIAEVVAVMRAEAEARGLPFLDVAGRFLIKRAIKNARKSKD